MVQGGGVRSCVFRNAWRSHGRGLWFCRVVVVLAACLACTAVDSGRAALQRVAAVRRGDATQARGEARTRRSLAGKLELEGSWLRGRGEVGFGAFGGALALSGNGRVALVAAPSDRDHAGAVWFFRRAGSGWLPSPRLTGCETGASKTAHVVSFGFSVALTADGDTALVGCPGYRSRRGAVGVYVRNGSIWTQTALLAGRGETGPGEFGFSVTVAANGRVAAVGAPIDSRPAHYSGRDGIGAVWVFRRSGSGWHQEGPKLVGGGESAYGDFGTVALSADGSTLLVGAPNADGHLGAAWIFAHRNGRWVEQSGKLTGCSGAQTYLGWSVALSGNGDTALIACLGDDSLSGAVLVYARTRARWHLQATLRARGEQRLAEFGYAVALSASGRIAVIGSPGDNHYRGAVWTFMRSGTTWTQARPKLSVTPRGIIASSFGYAVAASADARLCLAGAPTRTGKQLGRGAAWVYQSRKGQPC